MREHEVSTHLQTEDKVLLGLTFPQIVAIAAVVGLAYGLWKQAAFLPDGAFRLGAAIAVGLLGLAMVAVRPGGRGLPTVILDLLRFALSPKRYEGEVTALLNPPVATPPKSKSQKKKGRRRLWRFRLKGLPFKCLSLLLAVMVILTSIAPSAALAAGPASEPDPQRLFIEAWRVRGNEAELTLRAATSLEVQVTTETHDRYRPFYTQGVLYRGEPREYTIPLAANHKAIVISWRDALGNGGIRVLDQNSIPYPLPGLETADCGLSMTEVGWRLGNVTGRLSSACNSRAEEVVEATVLTDPADPAAAVSRKLLLDADLADVTGEVYLAASAAGSTTGLAFARDGDMPFNFSLPQEDRVHQVSLRVDITSTRVIPLPGRVDLTHNEEQSLIERIPVIGHFAGFYHTVSSTLSAWFGPVVHTVSATLSAWFGPVVRTLSATLSAAWGAVTHTVGGWISATVGKWLSALGQRRGVDHPERSAFGHRGQVAIGHRERRGVDHPRRGAFHHRGNLALGHRRSHRLDHGGLMALHGGGLMGLHDGGLVGLQYRRRHRLDHGRFMGLHPRRGLHHRRQSLGKHHPGLAELQYMGAPGDGFWVCQRRRIGLRIGNGDRLRQR